MEKIKFIFINFLVKYKYCVTNMYACSSIGITITKHPEYLPRKSINIAAARALLGIFLIDR